VRMRDGPPICLADSSLGDKCHICAFFSNRDDEYRTLMPFIKEGFERGEKVVHTIDPDRLDDHLERLRCAGLDVAELQNNGQFEVRTWDNTHLSDGRFDQTKTLGLFEQVVKNSQQQGFPLIRFITHMEWALQDIGGMDNLLEYEARANDIWMRQQGPVNPVICTYDLTKFSGDVVIDVMRTHPMIIIDGILQENPFFVPPDKFLQGLRARRSAQNLST
jgi:hypothetical protein